MSLIDRRSGTRAIVTVVAIPLVLAIVFIGITIARAATANVTIANLAYSPASITVNVGDSIIFTNSDAVTHTVTADGGSFDGSLPPGGTLTLRLPAGAYAYHCTIHPTMHGAITVVAAATGTAQRAGETPPTAGVPRPGTSAPPATGTGGSNMSDYTPILIVVGVVFVVASLSAGMVLGAARARDRRR